MSYLVGIDAGHGMHTEGKRTPKLIADIKVDGKVVKIASAVEREIIDDFEYMLSLKASGLDLFFTDIDFIKNLMLDELKVLN